MTPRCLHRGECWQPYSNLMVHQLCAAAHEAVPSYDQDVLYRCYTDDVWALAVAKQRLASNFAVVGVLERMDETLSLLDRAFACALRIATHATLRLVAPADPQILICRLL